MARNPKPSGKNVPGEYATFENALKKVLSVSHSEIQSKIYNGKKRRSKHASSRVSAANG